MIGITIDVIAVGDSAQITRRVTDGDIAAFVDAVGDHNPVHADREYAATTVFKEPIAPGIWTAGLISAVIGTRLPGPGAIYLSQDLKFLKPVKAGDSISARVEVSRSTASGTASGSARCVRISARRTCSRVRRW
jgi:acyl dehydratase